jgi:hypothetical protein
MKEILLSIYLIYGQTKKARAYFFTHKLHNRARRGSMSAENDDPLFDSLCQELPSVMNIDRLSKPIYFLSIDFPNLAHRLDSINRHVREHQPKSLSQLWDDNRNRLQWYTFWTVLAIGAIGLLLALVQIMLGALQVFYAAKALEPKPMNP